jgi:hypothetical protein
MIPVIDFSHLVGAMRPGLSSKIVCRPGGILRSVLFSAMPTLRSLPYSVSGICETANMAAVVSCVVYSLLPYWMAFCVTLAHYRQPLSGLEQIMSLLRVETENHNYIVCSTAGGVAASEMLSYWWDKLQPMHFGLVVLTASTVRTLIKLLRTLLPQRYCMKGLFRQHRVQ